MSEKKMGELLLMHGYMPESMCGGGTASEFDAMDLATPNFPRF